MCSFNRQLEHLKFSFLKEAHPITARIKNFDIEVNWNIVDFYYIRALFDMLLVSHQTSVGFQNVIVKLKN